jgi:hypothetical protein
MSVLLNTVFHSLDVMVLNDIIEQAAGRPGRASEQGGKYSKLTSQCLTVGVSVQVTSQNPPLYMCFHIEPLDPTIVLYIYISGTGFSNYDTMNLFVRLNNLGVVQCLCQAYAVSCDEDLILYMSW